MRVALISFIPEPTDKNYLAFNHGLAQLSSVVKKDGHQTKLFLISKRSDDNISHLFDFKPDALFVYLTTNQYRLFRFHLKNTLAKLNVPIIAGGPHPTCSPEATLELEELAGVCIGEGELAAPQLLKRIGQKDSFEEIPNVWFKKGSKIIRNPVDGFVADLDDLPFADREIFPFEKIIGSRAMDILGFEFFFSRGCTHECAYCINPYLNRLKGKETRLRRRSVESVVEEIREVITRYNHKGLIGFQDDIFTLNQNWLEEFAEQYRKRIALPFWCNSHVSHLSEKAVRSLRHAGCVRVQIGIECGNEAMREKLLGKRFTNDQVLEVTERLKKHHIKIVTYFMLGLPYETEGDLKESVALCGRIRPDWIIVSTFCPYPGTRAYEDLVSEGRLNPRFWEEPGADTYYSPELTSFQDGLSPQTYAHYYRNFAALALGRGFEG